MPITYAVDHGAGIVRAVWTGRVDAPLLAAHWQTLLDDDAVWALGAILSDVREAEVAFGGTELQRLIDAIVQPRLLGRQLRTAIVVGGPVQYGLARQYIVFAEPVGPAEIFHDMATAERWLLAAARA